MTALPRPQRERWQPLRAGLVDLFYYDEEEFWFHDGRLLLRGNNGTGKSKVLALLLPFLLDGDLSPHRVEPDADSKKRMEWNLLLGGEHPFPERLGYTWLEFGRVTDTGETEFTTLGCGLKAVAGRGIARHWFFVTDQRVRADLELIDATGTALPRERLADALTGRGVLYDRARDYRRAVDEALFGLGEQRYGALVDLLIALRQPQLSKRPSERALSDALTEALPPLDQAVVADVAEAFRSLEEDRDELTAMTEAHTSAQSFLTHYRGYARIAARRRAAGPRTAQQSYEKARAALAEADAEHERAERALTVARARLAALEVDEGRLRARVKVLEARPEMRDGARLREAAERARREQRDAGRAEVDARAAASEVADRTERLRAAADRATRAAAGFADRRGATGAAADRAGLGRAHRGDVDGRLEPSPVEPSQDEPSQDEPGPDGALDDALVTELAAAAGRLADRQDRAVAHVDALLAADEAAQRLLLAARAEVDRLGAAQAELAQRRSAAADQVGAAAGALLAASRAHLGSLHELRVADPAVVLAALELWVETIDGPNPARATLQAAAAGAATELGRAEAALDQRDAEARALRSAAAAEVARLEAGEHTAPPVPHTRDPAARVGRPGAPLWQLVDFTDDVDSAGRAGLEAALEAAGVLDAWLAPDGTLHDAAGDDVLLRPAGDAPRPGRSLLAALRPAVDRADPRADAVSDAAVAGVLAAIGYGEHGDTEHGDTEYGDTEYGDTWVDPGGRFRIGVLAGSWHKPTAQFVGRGAREAARRERLAELLAILAGIDADLSAIATELAALAGRRAELAVELAGLPDDETLRNAHAAVAALAGESARLTGQQEEAAGRLGVAADGADAARTARTEGAADVGLPDDRPGLAGIRIGLTDYRLALAELWPAARTLTDARRALAETAGERARAEEGQRERAARAAESRREAEQATEAHRTLRETVGAAVAEVEKLLAAVSGKLEANTSERRTAGGEQEQSVAAQGRAEGRRLELGAVVEAATAERTQAAESLQRFTGTGLLAIALPQLETPESGTGPWAPDPTVRLARQIDRELVDVPDDDGSSDRAARRLTEEFTTLTETLSRQGNSASMQLLEDGIVVEVVFRGRPAPVPDLVSALATDVADRRRLLDEREREILENHLVNEVASTLQELIAEAERQVAVMNAELDGRPTSTGMRLRLEWRPHEDGPAGLAEARRRLLRQTSDAWSEDDRAAVGGFLQQRIAEIRSREDTGTWLEHLTEALDYRSWHRFVIQRHQNGQWRPAGGPASGGERVLAASVPLFAAASAHYASAGNPHAPRLVTLDEAFAGVDDNARAKYLGLLAAFDLDVVMTSEREWGCYPEVPGLAIAQLARTDGIAAVLVSNWRWDGRQRHPVPRPLALAPAAVGTPGHSAAAEPAPNLFDDP